MLELTKILIVEDEAVIAMHLEMIIEDLGGQVIGPAVSVAEALALIAGGAKIEGAVLDGNLGDGDVTPVALELIEKAIPVVIYSGVGVPADLAAIYPHLPVVLKPQAASRAIDILVASIACQTKAVTHRNI